MVRIWQRLRSAFLAFGRLAPYDGFGTTIPRSDRPLSMIVLFYRAVSLLLFTEQYYLALRNIGLFKVTMGCTFSSI